MNEARRTESPIRPLHVLMVSDVFFPRINGVSTSIDTFCGDLAAEGVEVTLIAPDYGGDRHHRTTHAVPARRLPFDPEDRLMHWRPLRAALEVQAARRTVDLVHIQTPFAAHFAGARFARRHRIPAVATYHTHFEEYIGHYLPLLPRPALRFVARQIARRQCNGLDGVIVPSAPMQATLADYGVAAPMHVLPTGIAIHQFSGGDRAGFRARHGIAPTRPVALFVGRAAHEKNIDFLIDMTAQLVKIRPDFLLLVTGEGPALPALRKQASALGLDANVRFLGYLDRQAELPACYAAADVFVFSSRTETQGLVLLEAMAAGLPVYAFAEMGTRDIIEPRRGAIPAPQERDAFAAGLAQLLDDRPCLERMAEEGRRFAATWSAPERARQLAALYRRLAR